jgi:hypothetical protein
MKNKKKKKSKKKNFFNNLQIYPFIDYNYILKIVIPEMTDATLAACAAPVRTPMF